VISSWEEEVSDTGSNSGTGVEARQPEITLQALLLYTSNSFLVYHRGRDTTLERRMKGQVG